MERSPITCYQEKTLRQSFEEYDYPFDFLKGHMGGVLIPLIHTLLDPMPPGTLTPFSSKEEWLNGIIGGGSLAYNAVVHAMSAYKDNKNIFKSLKDHNVKEKYRWVYICTWTGNIISRSTVLYDTVTACKANAIWSWDDNLGILPTLCVESICKCYEHLPPGDPAMGNPCECV